MNGPGVLQILRSVPASLLRGEVPARLVLLAAYRALWGSAVLVCAAVGLVGASLCWQAAWQARRVLGDQGFIGPEYLSLMVTEFTPLMVGTMLAARGGAGLAARLATRKATSQVDSILLMGDDPLRLLVVPEILGAMITAVLLAPPALLAGEVAGIITMKVSFSVEPATFLALDAIRPGDLVFALLKTMAFGLAVTVMAARAGLGAQGDASGVGHAATRGVVDGSVVVLLLDALLGSVRLVTGFP